MTLTRRTPLRAKPRAKGNRAELAIRDAFRAAGWPHAQRNWQSGGQGGGDIINGPAGVHVEVKWCERADIWAWLRQAEGEARPTDIPAVFCRCNATPWFVVLPRDEWDALDALNPTIGVGVSVVVGPGQRLSLWKHIAAAEHSALVANRNPRLRFSRTGSGEYVAVRLGELLALLRLREAGL